MEKEFVSYEQALALKELGFDEPCFGIHYNEGLNPSFMVASQYGEHGATANGGILAPLYQQAFRWFREKHGTYGEVSTTHNYATIYKVYTKDGSINTYKLATSYEEAEQECLKKLIEIVKNN
jgi:hypothetical protein